MLWELAFAWGSKKYQLVFQLTLAQLMTSFEVKANENVIKQKNELNYTSRLTLGTAFGLADEVKEARFPVGIGTSILFWKLSKNIYI